MEFLLLGTLLSVYTAIGISFLYSFGKDATKAEVVAMIIPVSISFFPFIVLLTLVVPFSIALPSLIATAALIAMFGLYDRRGNRLGPDKRHFVHVTMGRSRFKKRAVIAGVGVSYVTLWNWHSALGVHSSDMGLNVFWAKVIYETGRLPNYAQVAPLDQATKYVFGQHALLAATFLLTPDLLEELFWFVPLLLSLSLMLVICTWARAITNSVFAALTAGLLYGSASFPGAFIQRGNLGDALGQLLLVSGLYLLSTIRKPDWRMVASGLCFVSIIAYHQLSVAIALGVVVMFLVISLVTERADVVSPLKTLIRGRLTLLFMILLLVAAIVLTLNVTYINSQASGQLASTDWKPYVIPLTAYPELVGPAIFWLGLLGLLILVRLNSRSDRIIVSWIAALIILANGPYLGIQIEPYRFVWRLVEPLSIAAAVFVLRATRIVQLRTIQLPVLGIKLISVQRRRIAGVLLLLSILSLTALQVVGATQPRYMVSEDLSGGSKVAGWLGDNARPGDTIAVDAVNDNTATWIQAFSPDTLHFVFMSGFSESVIPANFRSLQHDIRTLYYYPGSSSVLNITREYNVRYVVVTHVFDRFRYSPFFQLAFEVNAIRLYEVVRPLSYGQVKIFHGWILGTESGRTVAACMQLDIEYKENSTQNITFFIHSHATIPPVQNSSLSILVDSVSYSSITIGNAPILDAHTDFQGVWPGLAESGVGPSQSLSITMSPGIHSISMKSLSAINFEVYLEDLMSVGVSFYADTAGT